jgi:CheY-like chemotaxis protein
MENAVTESVEMGEVGTTRSTQGVSVFSGRIPPPEGPHFKTEFSSDPSSPVSSPDKLKILVADDEPLVALTLAEILTGEGFEVMSVSNGAAAVEAARSLRPDILLSDVMMPKMNGIEAAKKIMGFLPDCRIILLSGQAATGDLLKQAHDQGHDFELVTKPIQPDFLLAILRQHAEE